MRISRSLWIIGLLLAAFIAAQPFTHSGKWERYTKTGNSALEARDFAEADSAYRAALAEARHFGSADPRFQESLDNLEKLSRAETTSAHFGPHSGQTTTFLRGVGGGRDKTL